MSGWTTFEAHTLDDGFSDEGREKIVSEIESVCDEIIYSTNHRVVGVMRDYDRYPDESVVRKVSKYDSVAVVVAVANDTSDAGTTELHLDGYQEEMYPNDPCCETAMEELRHGYGIRPYIKRNWQHMDCQVNVHTEDRMEFQNQGYIQANPCPTERVTVRISEVDDNGEFQSSITAMLSDEQARAVVRDIQDQLGESQN